MDEDHTPMSRSDIEQVLRRMLDEAHSPIGQISDGQDPAAWIAGHFVAWWHTRVEEFLVEGEEAAERLQGQLEKVLTWEQHGDSLHELIHVRDAFSDIRGALALDGSNSEP